MARTKQTERKKQQKAMEERGRLPPGALVGPPRGARRSGEGAGGGKAEKNNKGTSQFSLSAGTDTFPARVVPIASSSKRKQGKKSAPEDAPPRDTTDPEDAPEDTTAPEGAAKGIP